MAWLRIGRAANGAPLPHISVAVVVAAVVAVVVMVVVVAVAVVIDDGGAMSGARVRVTAMATFRRRTFARF